jgi:hypothetical protein
MTKRDEWDWLDFVRMYWRVISLRLLMAEIWFGVELSLDKVDQKSLLSSWC